MVRLIDKYLPSDYTDRVATRIRSGRFMTVDQVFELMFCHFPKPVMWLMTIRNIVVKPFGLQRDGTFRHLIIEQDDDEIVLGKYDRHLSFWVSIYCSKPTEGGQEASVTTVVKFNSLFGKVYFFAIWIFHKILVKSLFRKATIQQLCRQ